MMRVFAFAHHTLLRMSKHASCVGLLSCYFGHSAEAHHKHAAHPIAIGTLAWWRCIQMLQTASQCETMLSADISIPRRHRCVGADLAALCTRQLVTSNCHHLTSFKSTPH